MTKKEALEILMSDKIEVIDTEDFADAYNMAVATMERSSWIPATEKLPEETKDVLVTSVGNDGIRFTDFGMLHSRPNDWWSVTGCRNIIAWMPLPEPYEYER